MDIGKRIIEFRKKENMTQEQLASQLQVARQTISNWESNITNPDISQVIKLSNIFKVSVNDLLNEQLEIECKKKHSILDCLIGCECFLDIDDDVEEYRMGASTKCKILSIDDNYLKFEFLYGKEKITKLMDIRLIHSFKIVEKKGAK